MYVFTPCWGTKHIGLLEHCLLRSLKLKSNYEEVKTATFFITIQDKSEAPIIEKIVREALPDVQIAFLELEHVKENYGIMMVYPLIEVIKECLVAKQPLLMATPDFYYSDGTIGAFKAIANEPGSCATIAHMRVLPTFLDCITDHDGPELMSLAFNHAHRSWNDSPENLYRCGINKTKIREDLYAVQHYMPSPFFCNFTENDVRHFQESDPVTKVPPGFGMWDHLWPTHLLKAGRLRYIGSSDIASMFEVTDSDKNVPPIDKNVDGFFRKHFHNDIQKQFISCFRGISG